jgi:hypothetical protein
MLMPPTPADQPASGTARELTIVQFRAVLTDLDAERLRSAYGLKLDRHVPNLAYLERLPTATVESLRSDFLVRACVALDPAQKIAPWIRGGVPPGSDASSVHDFNATLFDDADAASTASAFATLGASSVQSFDDREIGADARVHFTLNDLDLLTSIAEINGVAWIEPIFPLQTTSVAAAVMQSGSAANTPIWDMGLHGEGQIIDVIDDGWPGINHCFFADVAPNQPGPRHRKVVHLRGTNRVPVPLGTPPGQQLAINGHAWFVCGIVAGDELNNSGHHPHRGGAWAAKLTCGNKNDLMPLAADASGPARPAQSSLLKELLIARADGAFIHSFSWILGAPFEPLAGVYDRTALDVDLFTWQYEEHLVVSSAANSVGTATVPKVNSPGIAKNSICVAAAGIFSDHGSGVAGPTVDGRRKPDVMAVGDGLISSAIPDAANNCAMFQSQLAQTSWATPHAAAAAALVRQYFTEGWYPVGKKIGTPQYRRQFGQRLRGCANRLLHSLGSQYHVGRGQADFGEECAHLALWPDRTRLSWKMGRRLYTQAPVRFRLSQAFATRSARWLLKLGRLPMTRAQAAQRLSRSRPNSLSGYSAWRWRPTWSASDQRSRICSRSSASLSAASTRRHLVRPRIVGTCFVSIGLSAWSTIHLLY